MWILSINWGNLFSGNSRSVRLPSSPTECGSASDPVLQSQQRIQLILRLCWHAKEIGNPKSLTVCFKWSDFVPWTLETTRLLTSAEYKDVQDSALKVWRVRIQGFFWWRGTNLNSYCQYETIINFLPVESYQLLDCILHSTSLYRNHTKPIAESSPLSSTTSVSFLANNKSMPLKCPHSLPPLSRQGWPTSSTYSKAASRTLGHSLTSQALVHPSLLRYCSCTKTARSKSIMIYRTLTFEILS